MYVRTGEHEVHAAFFEAHEEPPEAEAEENDEELSVEDAIHTVISEIIEAIADAEEDDESVEENMDDFFIFRKGVDYRLGLWSVLPQKFTDELYEDIHCRKQAISDS
jgi:hypothetical protein